MRGWLQIIPSVTVITLLGIGCVGGIIDLGAGDSAAVSEVAEKAVDTAAQVGGDGGFGGALMVGYSEHVPMQMGFLNVSDLAPEGEITTVRVHNDSDQNAFFNVSYFAGHMGLNDQVMVIEVPAGEELSVELPCSEIMGLGPLDMPGGTGCLLADGEEIDNTMAVPGFLGLDYACGDVFEHFLTADVDDLDGDGDTEELILISEAFEMHLQGGGPTGHMHGNGPGMMGMHGGM